MAPFTRWQRFVVRLLPWYDAEETEAAEARTAHLVAELGRIQAIRVAYRDVGTRPYIDRRRVAR